jgi:uncharacterized membrane protein
MTQSRWKSYVLWAAIVAQVIVIADVVGLWSLVGIEKSVFSTVVAAVLQMLVIVGVINNPTDKENW